MRGQGGLRHLVKPACCGPLAEALGVDSGVDVGQRAVCVALGHALYIASGAKRAARAGQHDNAHFGVGFANL